METNGQIYCSIIIVTLNEEKNIDLCLQAIISSDYLKKYLEVVLVDNGSIDNTMRIAEKYPVKIIKEHKRGISEARNAGINASRGDYLFFLDADTKVSKDFIKNIVKGFLDDNLIGASGGKILPLEKNIISDYLGISLFERLPRYKQTKYLRAYPGCGLVIKRSVLKKIGNFKENLKTCAVASRFSEDKEICARIHNANLKILYQPAAILFHKNKTRLSELIKIWWYSAPNRVSNNWTLVLYLMPTLYLVLLIILIINLNLFYLFLGVPIFLCAAACLRAYIENGNFVKSIIVKFPLDLLSIMVISFSVLYNECLYRKKLIV